jgi:hypothetical protein
VNVKEETPSLPPAYGDDDGEPTQGPYKNGWFPHEEGKMDK